MIYRGKYPNNIASVSFAGDWLVLLPNVGDAVRLNQAQCKAMNLNKIPSVGEDIGKYRPNSVTAPSSSIIDDVKKAARELKDKNPGMLLTHAYELEARRLGYNTYAALRAAAKGFQ